MLRLRVATWNVHEGVPADGAAPVDPSSFWAALRDAEVDVAALQEVSFPASGGLDELMEAAELVGLPNIAVYPLSAACLRAGELSGLALLSRYPLRDQQRSKLPNPGLSHERNGTLVTSFDKGMLSAVLGCNGRLLRVVSLHAPPFHRFGRTAEEFGPIWTALARSIGALDDLPLLVGGDFNTGRLELLTQKMDGRLRRTIGDQQTHFDKATDGILYTDAFELLGAEVVETQSDHALFLAEFESAAPRPVQPSRAAKHRITQRRTQMLLIAVYRLDNFSADFSFIYAVPQIH